MRSPTSSPSWLRLALIATEGHSARTTGKDQRTVLIEMPGLPLDEVRYVDDDEQNIWDFPRLYVDGGSVVWCYAVKQASRMLSGEDEDG
jgi:hypothetical protein